MVQPGLLSGKIAIFSRGILQFSHTTDQKSMEEEEGERKAKDDDRSEIDLVEFSQKLSISACASSDADEDDEVVVLATTGPVALRDFPHPRHLCANFPFQSTPHHNFCSKCYCVSCEVVAPCSNWEGRDAHCHIISKKCTDKLETATPTENENENEKKIILIIEE